MRVAIYARVSTHDKDQDPETQLHQLRAWCLNAGHDIIAEYVDHVSGAKAAKQRPKLAVLFDDASKRKFDLVLVWALDRLSREGMAATVGYLQRLNGVGVAFHSYTEPLLSTDNELVRDIVLAVMASLAKQERQRISDRTRAGMARAKAQGKAIGRPAIDLMKRREIAKLAKTESPSRIAARLHLDPKTVRKYA
jgi:DNA invertase Pin-like site-specific DNA recombinase